MMLGMSSRRFMFSLWCLWSSALDTDWPLRILTSSPMGAKMDKEGWVCPRAWPQVPIPVHGSAPRTSRPSTSLAAETPCGSAHSQLKKDLLLQHHNLVNLLAALNVHACKEYKQHNGPAVLSRVREGNKMCTICQQVCSSTQALKIHIRGQHMSDPALQYSHCNFTAGDKYGLNMHMTTRQPTSKFQYDQCPRSHNTKGHLKQHQSEHQDRFWPCSHCRATFAQKSGLVKHIPRCPKQEGGAPDKEHICEICRRKYRRKGELSRCMKDKHK